MRERVAVAVTAFDPISQAGIASQLRFRQEVQLVGPGDGEQPAVAIVVVDRVDEQAVQTIRAAQRHGGARVVVVASQVEGADLLGRLMQQVARLQRDALAPRGLTPVGMSKRELHVLRLVADGHATSHIARELAYSERTVKNILHDVTTRLQLRNRAQAVAYAVREGLI